LLRSPVLLSPGLPGASELRRGRTPNHLSRVTFKSNNDFGHFRPPVVRLTFLDAKATCAGHVTVCRNRAGLKPVLRLKPDREQQNFVVFLRERK